MSTRQQTWRRSRGRVLRVDDDELLHLQRERERLLCGLVLPLTFVFELHGVAFAGLKKWVLLPREEHVCRRANRTARRVVGALFGISERAIGADNLPRVTCRSIARQLEHEA